MRLAVLGPLALEGPQGTVAVPGRKARELLTALALASPEAISLDRLVDLLWTDPPPSAVKVVQAHASRLRRALAQAGAPHALHGTGTGYRIEFGGRPDGRPDSDGDARLDGDVEGQLDRFELEEARREAEVARDRGDARNAVERFAAARARWRGEPELPDTPAGEALRRRLHDERLELAIAHLACVVDTDAPERAVAELAELVAAEPLNERLWELRILALYRSGRPTEALRAYRQAVAVLAEEVGVAPRPALADLEAAILAHDGVARGPGPPAPAADRPTPVPSHAGPIRFTRTGTTHLAHRWLARSQPADGRPGDLRPGVVQPPVLLLNPGVLSIDALFDEPHLAAALAQLARDRPVLMFDPRGIGLSDRTQPPDTITIEDWVDDAVAVLDAAGVASAHVFAANHGGLVGLALAARQPGRVRSLTLVNAFARSRLGPDYPHGIDAAMDTTLRSTLTPREPGTGVDALSLIVPTMAGDPEFRAWWDGAGRRAAGPAAADALIGMLARADVRPVLSHVEAPTLVVVGRGCPVYDPAHGEHLVRHLPNATLASHRAIDDAWWIGDGAFVLAAFERFVGALPG